MSDSACTDSGGTDASANDGLRVTVSRAALNMALNALRRDAEEGRPVRAEIAELLAGSVTEHGEAPAISEPSEVGRRIVQLWGMLQADEVNLTEVKAFAFDVVGLADAVQDELVRLRAPVKVPEGLFPDFMRKQVVHAIGEANEPRGMAVHDGRAKIGSDVLMRMLQLIEEYALPSAAREPRFKVSITQMQESHQKTYWVVLTNSSRPDDADIFDGTGKITPFYSQHLERAEYEAAQWAAFLGVPSEEISRFLDE